MAESTALTEAGQFHHQLQRLDGELTKALPVHIPVERFMRVVATAVRGNADLLRADRTSLLEAAMKAAQDGLLPDGREGAFVLFGRKVTWLPMIAGVLKKIRNSGQLAGIATKVVYAGDKYRCWIDDKGEHLEYEASETPDLDTIRWVFAAAWLKDGTLQIEPMRPAEIEKVRKVSRAKDNGPWVDWWEQMAQKTALRRLSKHLPMSTDLDDLVRRDDELYDFKPSAAQSALMRQVVNPLTVTPDSDCEAASQVSRGVASPQNAEPDRDQGSEQATEQVSEPAAPSDDSRSSVAGALPERQADAGPTEAASGHAETEGQSAPKRQRSQPSPTATKADAPRGPKIEAEYIAHVEAWSATLGTATALTEQWKSERALRRDCGVTTEEFERLKAHVEARIREIKGGEKL